MSIRELALELYRLERRVEELQSQVKEAAPEARDDLEFELRRVRAERDRLRGVLEAKKEPPPYRRSFR